jgi:hypothetical protein
MDFKEYLKESTVLDSLKKDAKKTGKGYLYSFLTTVEKDQKILDKIRKVKDTKAASKLANVLAKSDRMLNRLHDPKDGEESELESAILITAKRLK